VVNAWANGSQATALCPAGTKAISGGGDPDYDAWHVHKSVMYVYPSNPDVTGWTVSADRNTSLRLQAQAICGRGRQDNRGESVRWPLMAVVLLAGALVAPAAAEAKVHAYVADNPVGEARWVEKPTRLWRIHPDNAPGVLWRLAARAALARLDPPGGDRHGQDALQGL
jgi:hypothetical protein